MPSNTRDDEKVGCMFWIHADRKEDFALACKLHHLNMTDAFERFITAMLKAKPSAMKASVDLRPLAVAVGGRGQRRQRPEERELPKSHS